MKKAVKLCLISFLGIAVYLLCDSGLYAQNLNLDNAAAIIEYDSLEISTSGKKAGFIKFYFRRKYKVRIQTEAGAEAFSKLSIPESFDPALYHHNPEGRNIGKHLSNINVENFEILIHKIDGQIITPEISPLVETYKSVELSEDKYGNYERYIFNIEDLVPGDVLELEYRFSVPYSENLFSLLTFRIFFHGDFPIINKDFVFILEKSLEAEVNTAFGEDPIIKQGKKTIYSWHFENLEACMNESGIRPQNCLPYVIISIKPYEMIYTLPYSFEEKFIPFYVFGPSIRESRHLTIVRAMMDNVNSSQYNQLRRFMNARLENIPDDSTGYMQLYTVHNYIAENFEFDPDDDYFNRIDTRDEKLGDYTTDGVIRDRSRYNVYVGLIAGLGLNYYTAYLADVRSGVISDFYFEPTISNDYIFAVLLKTGAVQFIYPKKERFGYYLNELPFYFENAVVRLIYLDDFRYIKEPIQEKFLSITTPSSSSSDNTRKQIANVHVDVDKQTVVFDASISLSGQFSTLGRGAYLYNTCDPTVNPLYCIKFWESISPDIDPENQEIVNIEQDYPFKTNIKASFSTDKILSRENDTLILDLSGWFNHIIDLNLNAERRVLTYYPDFKYTDSYTYQLNFDKKVKVLDRLPIIEINNLYGTLILKCVQKLDGTILLSSRVIVKAEKIPPENIMAVSEIQEQIKKLSQIKMKLLLKE